MPASGLTEIASVACLFLIFLVPFAGAGLSFINAGLGRSRSAAHSILTALAVGSVAMAVYFVCGFAWQGYPGGPAHVIHIAGNPLIRPVFPLGDGPPF